MDSKHLKMIANPHLLNKNIKRNKNEKVINLDTEELLYDYLSKKYREVYIHPTLFYQIKSEINDIVTNHVVQSIIYEMVVSINNKFDN